VEQFLLTEVGERLFLVHLIVEILEGNRIRGFLMDRGAAGAKERKENE
jgi:hypothetical protein